jgi:uncharacterized protein (TIGR02001 family)
MHMRKSILAVTAATALSAPLLATAADSPFSANVSITSQYIYRGIAQSGAKPAIQGGFDYANPNGLYAGTWASSISWLQDTGAASSAGMEWDFYGGYKGTVSGDLGFDVGLLRYYYPLRNLTTGFLSPDTTELYGGLSYKWLTVKYSRTVGTALFGWANTSGGKTTGSGYLDVTGSFDLGSGWGISAHAGHQTVNGFSPASYSDWRLGVSKDVGFGTVGLALSGTNAQDSCSSGQAYCFGPAGGQYSAGKGTVVLSLSKSF